MSGFVRNIVLAGVIAAGCIGLDLLAAAPNLTRLTPMAAVPGTTTTVSLSGENLTGVVDLWTSFPCEVTPGSNAATSFQLTLPSSPRAGIGAVRLVTTNGLSALHLVLIDALPAIASSLTNHTAASAQPLPRGSAIEGACEELRSDFFRISAKKGERIAIEVVAQRTGSPLDPFLRLLDASGREITFNEDVPGLGTDARLDVRCPKSGDYLVELRDSRHGGGSRHRYQLRFNEPLPAPLPFIASEEVTRLTGPLSPPQTVKEAEPNDNSDRPQRISLPAEIHGSFGKPGDRDVYEFSAKKGERLIITGATRSLGSPCDLFLQLQSTNGTKIAEANSAEADEGAITNRFGNGGTYRLAVEELTGANGASLEYRIRARELKPGFVLSTETDRISGPAGKSFEIEVKAERRDYDGPIELSVEGLPATFSLANSTIPAKTNAAKLKISAPADTQLGDFFPCSIVGRAVIEGASVNERVSTLPALRAAFPMLRHPPGALDGLLTLSISESKSTNPKPPQKKRKK